MVTLVELNTVASYLGLSTDTKPTVISDSKGMPNGSRFIEMDTGKKYFWNVDNTKWVEKPASSEGGGDSSDDSVFIIKVWGPGTNMLQKDKTFAEIHEAAMAGKACYVWYEQNMESWDESVVSGQCFVLSNISEKTIMFYRIHRTKIGTVLYYTFKTMVINSDETITFDSSANISSTVSMPTSAGTEGQIIRASSTGGMTWADYPTYSLSISDNVITLTGSDGTTSSITLPS